MTDADPGFSPMSIGELGRNVAEVKTEQREQRKQMSELKDKQITEKDLQLALLVERRATFRWNVAQFVAIVGVGVSVVAVVIAFV